MSMNDFTYSEGTVRRAGPCRCIILDAHRAVSKSSGKPMLTLTFRPSGTVSSVQKHIVDNEYFDANVSRLMDAFPQISKEEGVTFPERWRGAIGVVKLAVDEDGYYQVADRGAFIPAQSDIAEELPEFVWRARRDEDPEMPVFGDFDELEDEAPMPF